MPSVALTVRSRIEALRKPDCTLCGLSETTTGHVCVTGRWGSLSGEMVIIGEAPGQAEAKTGMPFMGQAGQLLNKILSDLDLWDYYITNVVKCRPPQNRKPTPYETKTCGRTYLELELRIIKPKVVVLLGKTAIEFFFGKHQFVRGKQYRLPRWPGVFVPTWHPAYCLRNPRSTPQLIEHLGIAKKALNQLTIV